MSKLKVGDIVYYDREIYDGFIEILYGRKHIVTKIENRGNSIWTKGYGWNYRDFDSCPNELITTKFRGREYVHEAIKRVTSTLYNPKTWDSDSIKYKFV